MRIKFTFPIEMSSIFNSIYVDKFELSEYVHYTLVYYDKDGEIIREVPSGGVTVDMVDEEDRQYLSVAKPIRVNRLLIARDKREQKD